MSFTLRRLDSNPIPEQGAECRAVIIIRNEALRLPWLLDYYRQQGIARFFVIDNESEDGSRAFLSQQKDCHVFATDESYAAAKFGIAWQMQVMNHFNGNHWWLVVDADEMFVYPGSEKTKLPDFCRYLDSIGAEGVYALMLDMYNNGPVAQAIYKSGQSFLDVCPCFDTEYVMHRRLKKPWGPQPFPAEEPVGGPRLRRFYPEYHRSGHGRVVRMKAMRRLRDVLRRLGVRLNIDYAIPPTLFKVPLLRWKTDTRLVNSHAISPLKLAPVTGVLLHFKFFADFHERVTREVARREHFDEGSEYARYLKVLQDDPRMSFHYEKSAHYSGTEQLVKLGLMKDDPSFETYRIAGPKS